MKNSIFDKLFKTTAVAALVLSSFAVTNIEKANAAGLPTDFNDVPAYAKTTIQKLFNENKIGGFPDGSFQPLKSLTRAEFVAMILRTYDFEESLELKYDYYHDADKMTEWQYNVMVKAYKVDLISGVGTSLAPPDEYGLRPASVILAPDKLITREEMAAILTKANSLVSFENELSDAKINETLNKFSGDKHKISSWAKSALATSVSEGLIGGTSATTLNPKGIATRTEAAVLMDRLAEKIKGFPTSISIPTGTTISGLQDIFKENKALPNDFVLANKLGNAADITSVDIADLVERKGIFGGSYGTFYFKVMDGSKETFIPVNNFPYPSEDGRTYDIAEFADEVFFIDYLSRSPLTEIIDKLTNDFSYTDIQIYVDATGDKGSAHNETTLIDATNELFIVDTYNNVRGKLHF